MMSETLVDDIARVANMIAQAIKSEACQVFLFGVGGSVAICESISQDLKGFYRPSDRTISVSVYPLTTETGFLTQILNDHSAEEIFSWQIETSAKKGDIAIAISTSGDSASVVRGARAAKDLGLTVIALTGKTGGKLAEYLQENIIRVPSLDIAHIEDALSTIAHTICQEVRDKLSQS
jgi:D-sedoheptulose 7-phosphate isomerase